MSPNEENLTESAVGGHYGAELAKAQAKPIVIEAGIPFRIDSHGKAESLEQFLTKPVRAKLSPSFHRVQSFIDYVNRFKENGNTLISVEAGTAGAEFTAHIDRAVKGGTSWNEHKATYEMRPTTDWEAWIKNDKRQFNQVDFCEFVDTQRGAFVEPNMGDMLDIARSIEAKTGGSFSSGVRLANGDRKLEWVTETTAAVGGRDTLEIPEMITIALRVFEGGKIIQIQTFLRYRIAGGAVAFSYQIVRPEDVIEEAVTDAIDSIITDTEIPVYRGKL